MSRTLPDPVPAILPTSEQDTGALVHALFRAAAVAARAATRSLRHYRLSVEEHAMLMSIARGRGVEESGNRWTGVRFALIERGLVRARRQGYPGYELTERGAEKLAATVAALAQVEAGITALLGPFVAKPLYHSLDRLATSRLD